jgi:hypothetical protein
MKELLVLEMTEKAQESYIMLQRNVPLQLGTTTAWRQVPR